MSEHRWNGRFEAKCTFRSTDIDLIKNWLRLHPALMRSPYPARVVRNVYFDSFELGAYAENLSGISVRTKARYRWYDGTVIPGPGVLEFKCKRETLGTKLSKAYDASPFPADRTWRSFVRALRAGLQPDQRILFDMYPQVVLTNAYRREYLVSADHQVRVTLDTDLVAYDQMHGVTLSERRIRLPDVSLLEVKVAGDGITSLRQVLADCPARVTRFSKYAVGAAAVLAGAR